MTAEPVSRADFLDILRTRLGDSLCRSPGRSGLEVLDSLMLVEAVEIVEELGSGVSEDQYALVRSLDDLYELYRQGFGDTVTRDVRLHELMSRSVVLRPVLAADMTWLYLLAQDPRVSATYRFRSTTPSPEVFNAALWDRVLTQFVVARRHDASPVGLVSAFSADLAAGHCEVGLVIDPAVQASRTTHDAILLFLSYLFDRFPLRKVYAEALQPVIDRLGSHRYPFVTEEGRRLSHERLGGTFVDLVLLAIYREPWRVFMESRHPHS